MMTATGLSREKVIETWFSTGTFRSRFNCDFGRRRDADR